MTDPSIREIRAVAVAILSRARVPSPEADADALIGAATGLRRGEVQAQAITGRTVDRSVADAVARSVARRAAREPLQHITGRAPFRGIELEVGPGVFVPRPETEPVAQLAIDALAAVAAAEPLAVDLGSGSGALALALATEVPHARVVAVELSPRALRFTRRNIAAIAPRVRLVEDDLAVAAPELDGTVDVVVSNPPYIPDDAIPRDPEVRLHDPAVALYGGADGLDLVRALSRRALALLRLGGALVIEHGEVQGAQIRALLTADGWRAVATHPDLTGRDRATTATR